MSIEPENEVKIRITPAGPEKSFRSHSQTSLDGKVNTIKSKGKSIMVNRSSSKRSGIKSRPSVELDLNASQQFLGPKPVGQFKNFEESNQFFSKKHLDGLNHKFTFFGCPLSMRDQKVIPKSMNNITSGPDKVLEHPTGSKKKFAVANEHPMMGIPARLGKQTQGSFLATESPADIPENFPNMNLVGVLQDFDSKGRGLKFFKKIGPEDIDCVLNVAMIERQRYKEFMGCLNEFITQGKLTLATLPNWQRNEKTIQGAGTGQLVGVKSSTNLNQNGRPPVSQTAGPSWNNGASLGGG